MVSSASRLTRDVRIAFSTEIVRYCDEKNIDFYNVREKVNEKLAQSDYASDDPNAIPVGGILIPMLGVGGHCLPKDGILLWWRNFEKVKDTSSSLIFTSRLINDQSPSFTFKQAEKVFGNLSNKKIALLGVAYRFNSEDTRNSPTLVLANFLRENNVRYTMHDPFVKIDDQNLLKFNQQDNFTQDFDKALESADYVFICSAHKLYTEQVDKIISNRNIQGIIDACNIYKSRQFTASNIKYSGIGRGTGEPPSDFINFVYESFRAMEKGLALELKSLIDFYNEIYTHDEYNKVKFTDVQRLAKTCSTGCIIADPDKVEQVPEYMGFSSWLARCAKNLGN